MLKHDSQGFLVGERLDADEITGRLDAIHLEISHLRKDLARGPSQAVSVPRAASGKSVASPAPSARPVAPSAATNESSGLALPPEGRLSVVVATAVKRATREASGGPSQAASATPRLPARQGGKTAERDASGRFVGKGGSRAESSSDYGQDDDEKGIIQAVDGLGSRLAGAVKEMGEGTEQADPALRAFNEVARPLQRGFGKMFGDGGDRKQERWYRRFWVSMRDSRRESAESNKRQLKTLRNIERKPGGGKDSGLWRMMMFLFAPIAGLFSFLAGLPMAFAGALVGVLRPLLSVLGMGGIANKLPAGGTGGWAGGGKDASKGKTGGAGGAKQAGNAAKGARGGAGRGLARGAAKRIPFIGALLGLGFMASDVMASERGEGTRAEKDKSTGRAIGGGLGGLGGMAAGAAAGAALGSVVPVIGTAIGGVVGAVAGGFFGSGAGEIVGEKVGGWVTELRNSNFMGAMADSWDYATRFASSMWRQTSDAVAESWDAVSGVVRDGWVAASDALSETWGSLSSAISERWNSVTDGMKSAWDGALSLAASAWGTLTDAASGVNSWIEEKTGVNIADSVKDVAGTVIDGAKSAATAAKDAATAAADAAKTAANAVADSVTSFGAGAWDFVKSGASSAFDFVADTAPVRMARKAHGEASAEPLLVRAMAEAGITDPREKAAFMGQMHHESGGFTRMEENLNYKPEQFLKHFGKRAGISTVGEAEALMAQGKAAMGEAMYGGEWGRKNLGNTQAGDGYKFRGRGHTQLTGRGNYEAASRALGVDLVNNPDLATDPEIAAKIATWYWQRSGAGDAARRGDIKETTKLINGGYNGLDDRIAQTQRYMKIAQDGGLELKPAGEVIADPAPEVAASPDPASNAHPGGKPTDPFDTGDGTYAFTYEELVERSILRSAYAQNRDAALAGAATPAVPAAPMPPQVAAQPAPPSVPPVGETPTVRAPIATAPAAAKQPSAGHAQDVSRDISDRRIAHIVTGAYSGAGAV